MTMIGRCVDVAILSEPRYTRFMSEILNNTQCLHFALLVMHRKVVLILLLGPEECTCQDRTRTSKRYCVSWLMLTCLISGPAIWGDPCACFYWLGLLLSFMAMTFSGAGVFSQKIQSLISIRTSMEVFLVIPPLPGIYVHVWVVCGICVLALEAK